MEYKLVLGAGLKTREDAINVDIKQYGGIDVIMDLNIKPWVFPNDHFKEIWAEDIFEHLTSPLEDIEELYRICENNARVHITVPLFGTPNHIDDPTHLRGYGIKTFDVCDHTTTHWKKYHYTKANFTILSAKIEGFNVEFELQAIK